MFVAIVGPSGAGKDSVINGARLALGGDPRFVFPARLITRAADRTEAHQSIGVEDFCRERDSGAFVLAWEAHGLHYGLPAGISEDVARGQIVVANLSRAMVCEARSRFGQCHVVLVTATPEVLAARLAARGRETADMQARRLSRSSAETVGLVPDHVISNTGPLAEAIHDFTHHLKSLVAASPSVPAP